MPLYHDDAGFARAVGSLSERLSDLSPILPEIGEAIMTAVQVNFRAGGRFGADNPFGGGSGRWKPSTRATRQGGKTLINTGRLASSITYHIDGRTLLMGTNVAYGPIHQFGGYAGRGKKTFIPARPFLTITDEDLRDIDEVILTYYSTRFR